MTMTTLEKIKAIETSGLQLAWDRCHKIYFLEDEQVAAARELGYETFSATELRMTIMGSCSLVFVGRLGIHDHDWDHPWNIDQSTEDIYTAAANEDEED